jgi:hypothetical protein
MHFVTGSWVCRASRACTDVSWFPFKQSLPSMQQIQLVTHTRPQKSATQDKQRPNGQHRQGVNAHSLAVRDWLIAVAT